MFQRHTTPTPTRLMPYINWKEKAAKLILCGACGIFMLKAFHALSKSWPHPSAVLILLVISEILITILALMAKPPKTRDGTFIAFLTTFGATFYFLFISLSPGRPFAPIVFGSLLQLIGLFIEISAKIFLGKSFGFLPAVRGIITEGPYSIVRHPMYLGYFLTHMGFLLGSFSWNNLLVFIALYCLQIIRIIKEEKILSGESEYLAYMKKVRYRFIPPII